MEPILFSKNWDSRIAAGYAVEYAFKEMKENKSTDNNADAMNEAGEESLLKELDLKAEISGRRALLASAGSEFDLDLTISAAERLKISRANVKKSLGLMEGVAGMEELERELVKDEDLNVAVEAVKPAEPAVSTTTEMSARERSMMKRKARMASQNKPAKQVKTGTEVSLKASSDSLGQSDNYLDSIESDAVWFCELMKERLLK